MDDNSFRTVIRRGRRIVAEWFSLNNHPDERRREIARDLAQVIEYTIPRPDLRRRRGAKNTTWKGKQK